MLDVSSDVILQRVESQKQDTQTDKINTPRQAQYFFELSSGGVKLRLLTAGEGDHRRGIEGQKQIISCL